MRSFPKSFLRYLFWLAVGLELLTNAVIASDINPYRILGVSRHSSQAEIKRAYKQHAREWHPDKNKDPGAEDMFIKITKSYEILSNEERRANYDRFGQTGENKPRSQTPQGFQHFHESFFFDQNFFHFTQSTQDFADSKHMLHYDQYVSEVLPDSFKRPYLIKVTSERCFSCIYLEPIWKETVNELETLGVGIGVVDIGYEKRLGNLLGVHRPPFVLGLVNGRVISFHDAVGKENLRQFVESLLPQTLVEKVTDNNYMAFLNAWRDQNKPSVLLINAASTVPLLYKLAAFAFQDFVRFGYVVHGLAETARIQEQFSINTYAPTLLLFKENTEKPADTIQSRGIKKQLLDEFVSNNRFLLVPRLVNQKLFDELCPIKQFHRRRKYCVLLITGEEEESFGSVNAAFYDFASSNSKEVLRFAYVYQRQQKPLCDALLNKEDLRPPQVIILERRNSTGKVLYRTVTGGWNGSDEDKHRLHKQLELLQRDPAYLSYNAMLPELNNEFASMFLVRWLNSACDYLSEVYFDILHSNWREMMPVLSLIFSALFILFGTAIIQAFSDSGEEKAAKPKASKSSNRAETSRNAENTSSCPPKKNFLEVTELTDVTYTSNLLKLKPGHINVVLVVTEASRHVLLKKFAKEVFSFSGSPNIHFSFLNVDKHRKWMDVLLSTALNVRPSGGMFYPEPDYTGYVLALNGHKKYFCLYRPAIAGDKEDSGRSSDEDTGGPWTGVRARGPTRQRASTASHTQRKLACLSLWMERLTEGTLPRHYIPAWPDQEALQK